MLHPTPGLSVCLISCGEDTEPECRQRLEAELFDQILYEVRDVYPQSAASNAALRRCPTGYMLQVDSDMVLYRGWYDRVMGELIRLHDDPRWYHRLFWLRDSFSGERVLALKLVRVALAAICPYRDVRVPDRDHALRMAPLPYTILPPEGDPIGDHVLRGHERIYLKYKDEVLSARHYGDAVVDYFRITGRRLLKRYEETQNQDYLYAIAGMVDGLESGQFGSKRYRDVMRVDLSRAVSTLLSC